MRSDQDERPEPSATANRTAKRRRARTLPRDVTAKELGILLAQVARLMSARPTSNPRLGRALEAAADILASFGDRGFRAAFRESEQSERLATHSPEFSNVGLEDIALIVGDERVSRRTLIDIASSRFGMSRPSLNRMSIDAVREELATAIQHESSIAIISDVARRGG